MLSGLAFLTLAEFAPRITVRVMSQGRWEHFAHGADIGVRGCGDSLEAAFEQAALALTGVVTDPNRVEPRRRVDVTCRAPTRELLLCDWLNTLIYEMSTRRMLFGRFEVVLDAQELRARAWGEPVEAARHEPAVEPKGATFTELEVTRGSNGWRAQCVVDV